MNDESPESQIRVGERKEDTHSKSCLNTFLNIILIIALAVIVIVITLTLLGPAIGNVFSSIVTTNGPSE